MARLGDEPDQFGVKRVFSPDRRLALDFLPYPDPRTQYEVVNPDSVVLRDAESGAVLAEFGGGAMLARYDWLEGGGVEIELERGAVLRVAPDLATFRLGDESAPARPIGELPDRLRRMAPLPPPPPPRSSPPSSAVTLVLLALLLVPIGYGLSRTGPVADLIAWIRGEAPERSRVGEVNAWVVRCPGIGMVTMSLAPDGRLRVPERIAPAPLMPLDQDGRLFGDGRTVIAIDGTNARWWPDGAAGEAVACPSTRDLVP